MLDPGAGGGDGLLAYYWLVLQKRKWVVFTFGFALVLSVTIATTLSTPYYAATAVIEISPKTDTILDVDEVSEFVTASSSSELLSSAFLSAASMSAMRRLAAITRISSFPLTAATSSLQASAISVARAAALCAARDSSAALARCTSFSSSSRSISSSIALRAMRASFASPCSFLSRTAARKLDYVLRKRGLADKPKEDSSGRGRRGILI